MAHKQGLTQKNKIFADAYAGDSNEAAKVADLTEDYGRKLVQSATSPSIIPAALAVQERIKARESTEQRPGVATRQERQEFWTKIQRGELTDIVVLDGVTLDCRESQLVVRMKASELLGKSELDFGERRVNTDVSLADIAARVGSRRRVEATEPPKAIEGEQDYE